MELVIRILCFVGGIVFSAVTFFVYAWYLGMKHRIAQAEAERKQMEDVLKAVEAEQKQAAEVLQRTIAEAVKRRQGSAPATQPVPQVPQDNSVAASVKDRLRKAIEITVKQSKIDPKKGPEFQMQHNELELEKLNVLKTILADGFDPVITIRNDSEAKEMPLSAYVQSISKGLA